MTPSLIESKTYPLSGNFGFQSGNLASSRASLEKVGNFITRIIIFQVGVGLNLSKSRR